MHVITLSPIYARYVVRDFQRKGLPLEPLFEGTGLDRTDLQNRDSISIEDFNRLLENALLLSNDKALGLMIGSNVSLMTLGPVGVAAASAPNLRSGFQTIESFSRIHAGQTHIEASSTLQGMSICMRFITDLGKVGRFHIETGTLWLQHYVETMTGCPMTNAEFRMGFAQPDYTDAYRKHFHCPVSFGWQYTSLELPRNDLDTSSPYYSSELWQQSQLTLAERLRELNSQQHRSYSQHLHSLLRSCEVPLPHLTEIARQLHLSPRSLNRRLQLEGTGFRQIRNGILFEWARRYLTETSDTVESIAIRLGYEDASNFRRAFKAWEGCSPGAYRRQETQDK